MQARSNHLEKIIQQIEPVLTNSKLYGHMGENINIILNKVVNLKYLISMNTSIDQ